MRGLLASTIVVWSQSKCLEIEGIKSSEVITNIRYYFLNVDAEKMFLNVWIHHEIITLLTRASLNALRYKKLWIYQSIIVL